MAAKFESGLEPARQDFPEVSREQQGYGYQQPYQQQHQQQQQQPYNQEHHQHPEVVQPYYQQAYDPPKPEATPAPPSTYDGHTVTSPFSAHAAPATEPEASTKPSALDRSLCGCSLLVFVLSCIIALLAAAVIGLAAATGVQSQHASSAASSLADLQASMTATSSAPSASSTAPSVIDDGCSENPGSVNKTVYTSFSLLGGLSFTRYCNRDAPNAPLMSLFTSSFDTCMDACAGYTKYAPNNFDNATKATCAGVSFIPAWTNKVTASAGGAPGNCYLKPGPQNETALTVPNIGVDVHAAVLKPAA